MSFVIVHTTYLEIEAIVQDQVIRQDLKSFKHSFINWIDWLNKKSSCLLRVRERNIRHNISILRILVIRGMYIQLIITEGQRMFIIKSQHFYWKNCRYLGYFVTVFKMSTLLIIIFSYLNLFQIPILYLPLFLSQSLLPYSSLFHPSLLHFLHQTLSYLTILYLIQTYFTFFKYAVFNIVPSSIAWSNAKSMRHT